MRPASKRIIFFLSFFWALTLLTIGLWWAYLAWSFGGGQAAASGPQNTAKLLSMLRWEGATFIITLGLLSVTLFLYLLQDARRTRALQAFFASLTHELKTPLASIKLQAEVLEGHQDILASSPKVHSLLERLLEDVHKLEIQMDKTLHLSRFERGGKLNPSPLSLHHSVQSLVKQSSFQSSIHINEIQDQLPMASIDYAALEIIIKNLLENTHRHGQGQAWMTFFSTESSVGLIYKDLGVFHGHPPSLGKLFYKFQSSQGTGIGLYLVRGLMRQMRGDVTFSPEESAFTVKLSFMRSPRESS